MWKKCSSDTGISKYVSIIILNVNELNSPIKRHILSGQIKKQDLIFFCLQKLYQAFGNRKQAGVAIHITNKTTFKQKSVRKDKEDHSILTNATIQQVDITILNVYAPNICMPKFIKHTFLSIKVHIDLDIKTHTIYIFTYFYLNCTYSLATVMTQYIM
jgi:hypothetical protein